MMGGRKSKPIAIHKLEGTYRPCRHGESEQPLDSVVGIPTKPTKLGRHGSKLWDEICETLGPIGVLARIDAFQLEAVCEQWQLYKDLTRRRQDTKDDKQKELLEKRARAALQQFDRMSICFGLTPTSRASLRKHLRDEQKPKQDPLEEFGIIG